MKKIFKISCAAVIICLLQAAVVQGQPVRFADIQAELEASLSSLSDITERLEAIQGSMDASGRANENYNQQKNIFLSSALAISTISAICEYEKDLLTLFIDLKQKNRRKYYEVRINSLETSVRQIENMHRQIQINYTILPPNIFEAPLVRDERLAIESAVERLKRCGVLLKSVSQR